MIARKPEWLRIKHRQTEQSRQVRAILKNLSLHTVCQEAKCPNIFECFGQKTATFMILGKHCTRHCRFCNIQKGKPDPVDQQEPEHIVQAVRELGLKYVVITSVTRDDLPDGGAEQFYQVIMALRKSLPDLKVEVLIPDFAGNQSALARVLEARPQVINHNVETVPRLYSDVRPEADFERSLSVLKQAKTLNPSMITKSGMMLGLGEREIEVHQAFQALIDHDCSLLTLGQYLAPSRDHYPIAEYIHPVQFHIYQKKAIQMGFLGVASAPLVRSSHHAMELYEAVC